MNGHEILSTVSKPPTRQARQLEIEARIMDFRPDAIEAEEILQAIEASLQKRYEERSEEVCQYLKFTRLALQRLDSGWETNP